MLSPLRMPFRHARVAGHLQLRIIEQAGGIFHQRIFRASCNCLDVVTVEVMTPPFGSRPPDAVKMLSFVITGSWKLARFKTLKTSKRNWALKLSEILGMGLFLNNEVSRFTKPGPRRMFRPTLPRRLKHLRSPLGSGPPKLGGAGSQFAVQKAGLGAVGTAKHSVLR